MAHTSLLVPCVFASLLIHAVAMVSWSDAERTKQTRQSNPQDKSEPTARPLFASLLAAKPAAEPAKDETLVSGVLSQTQQEAKPEEPAPLETRPETPGPLEAKSFTRKAMTPGAKPLVAAPEKEGRLVRRQEPQTQEKPTAKPRPRQMTSAPYPSGALSRGEEGTVLILVAFDSNGRVMATRLEQGSGHAELDNAALSAASTIGSDASRAGATVIVPFVFKID